MHPYQIPARTTINLKRTKEMQRLFTKHNFPWITYNNFITQRYIPEIAIEKKNEKDNYENRREHKRIKGDENLDLVKSLSTWWKWKRKIYLT